MGDYLACLETISRSWRLSAGAPNPSLAVRLATRAAKALAHGVRGETIDTDALATHAQVIEQLENVALQQENADGEPESIRVWREWRTIAGEVATENLRHTMHA